MHRSRLRPWLTFALLTLGLSGCDGKPDAAKTDAKTDATKIDAAKAKTEQKPDAKPEQKAEQKPGEKAGCDAAHAKTIEQEIAAQCALVSQVLEVEVPAASWKPAPSAPPETALQLDLDSKGLVIGGFGDAVPTGELPGRFAEARERAVGTATSMGRPSPEGWVLTIASATPRADVATVLKTLADAGLREGHLRLATEPAQPLPAPRDPKRLEALATVVTGADPSQRAVLIAKEMEKAVSTCPAVGEAFNVLAGVAPAERCGMMSSNMSEALVRCGCANETEIVTLLYAITVGVEAKPRVGATVAVTLDPAAAPRAGATWAEVVAGLDAAALGTLWVSPS